MLKKTIGLGANHKLLLDNRIVSVDEVHSGNVVDVNQVIIVPSSDVVINSRYEINLSNLLVEEGAILELNINQDQPLETCK